MLYDKLLFLASNWKKSGTCDVVISTSDTKVVSWSYSCKLHLDADPHIVELGSLDKEQFLQALSSQPNFSSQEASILYDECGPALDFAVDMFSQNKNSHTYIQEKSKLAEEHIQQLLKTKPALLESVYSTVAVVSKERPLGDTFAGTEVAQEFKERGIMQEFPKGSTRFRNKCILKAVARSLS